MTSVGLSTASTPSPDFLELYTHPDPRVREFVIELLAEGLAYQKLDASLVIVAQALGIDARLIADEVVRQLNEMPSKEKH